MDAREGPQGPEAVFSRKGLQININFLITLFCSCLLYLTLFLLFDFSFLLFFILICSVLLWFTLFLLFFYSFFTLSNFCTLVCPV